MTTTELPPERGRSFYPLWLYKSYRIAGIGRVRARGLTVEWVEKRDRVRARASG